MTPNECERLAYAVNALRPDWPRPSLQTLLAKLTTRTLHDAAIAMAWVATDPSTQTPGRVLEAGPWWGATMRVASDAERHPSAVPINDLCHICSRERRHCEALDNGHDYKPRLPHVRETVNTAGARKVREALAAALPPTTDPDVQLVAIDGTDALAFVIIRPGADSIQGVNVEAEAKGINKSQAAWVLRRVADTWDPPTTDNEETT